MRRVPSYLSALAIGVALLVGPAWPAAAAATCSAGVVGDINGDGHADSAVGDVGAKGRAGAVQVRYGGSAAPAPQTLTQGRTGVGGNAEAGDHFGLAVVVAFVDGDACADLVISARDEDVDDAVDAGVVHVVFGSPAGAGAGRPPLMLQPGMDGLPGTPQEGARFGAAVAVGDDPETAGRVIAVGAPGADGNTGAVWTMTIDADAAVVSARLFREGSDGIAGTPQAGDRFGEALDWGYLSTGQRAGYVQDLLIGAPGENKAAGMAVVVADAGAPGPYTTQTWTQNSSGVHSSAEAGDEFGASLDCYLNPFTGERYVAIGAPGEDAGTMNGVGYVHLFRFPSSMTAANEVGLSQDVKGVAGAAEAGDEFGRTVELRTIWNTTYQVGLLVGVPKEDVGSLKDAGAAAMFIASASSVVASDVLLHENSPGVPGTAHAGDHFGAALGLAPDGALAVGAPDYAAVPTGIVVTIPMDLVFGRTTSGGASWKPSGGDRYGFALS